MMGQANLIGKLVRLTAPDVEKDLPTLLAWDADSEYQRLASTGPARLFSAASTRQEMENDAAGGYVFDIRTIKEDRLIGMCDLADVGSPSGDCWLGIGIGERAYWGGGYGTDAMRVLLRYAFEELNVRRISLNTFEYNPRAIRCYEKVGFRHEGRERQFLKREGRRWDLIYMSILRSEWEIVPER